MLKAVIDTSVFCAALKSKTKTSITVKILKAWLSGCFTLIMAPLLLEELARKLYEIGVPEQDVEDLILNILDVAENIPGVYEATRLDDIDPDDNMFIAAAYESKADYIVSRDNHLLDLKHSHGTQIVDPPLFLRVLTTRQTLSSKDFG